MLGLLQCPTQLSCGMLGLEEQKGNLLRARTNGCNHECARPHTGLCAHVKLRRTSVRCDGYGDVRQARNEGRTAVISPELLRACEKKKRNGSWKCQPETAPPVTDARGDAVADYFCARSVRAAPPACDPGDHPAGRPVSTLFELSSRSKKKSRSPCACGP